MIRCFQVLLSVLLIPGVLYSQKDSVEITFAEDIAPIIYENCVVCHRPEGVGPFSLIDYESVKRRSRQIAEVVASRYMPPWKPDPHIGPRLKGERLLSEDQIALIGRWHESGVQAGDLNDLPPVPEFSEAWQLGPPDLVLEFPEPYELQAAGRDVYRNFVIPAPVERTRYVRAIEFLPRTQLAIHHAVLQIDPTSASREKDELEPGPGYDGMGIGAAAPPEGQLVGWAPGQAAYQSYPGTAWKLEPGSDIVLQLHMLPSGKIQEVAPRIGVYFTDEVPAKLSLVLVMREFEIDIPPGEKNYLVEETMPIPVDVELIGLYPHAHYVGKDLKAYAVFPDGSKHWIFRIPDWDFNWQSDYRLVEPMKIPAGSTIHMVFSYDNSSDNPRNPSDPPRRVVGGWNSTDEMAELSLQFLLQSKDDLQRLKEAQISYDMKSAGGRSRYLYNLGSYFELQGVLEKAGEYYYDALQDEPGFASAHFKLGYVLERLGNLRGAEDRYRTALAIRPELIPANVGLARVQYQMGNDFVAIELLRQVLEWEPRNFDARIYLARIQESYSSVEKALEVLREGLPFHESNPHFRLELGKLLFETGDLDEALENYRFAAEREVELETPASQKEAKSLKSEAFRSMALVHLQKDQRALAESYLDQAIETMPFNTEALLDSALLALEEGDRALCLNRLAQLFDLPEDIRPPKQAITGINSSPDWKDLVEEAMRAKQK